MTTRTFSPSSAGVKSSILGLSIITQTIPLASVAIPALAKDFTNQSLASLQMISTMPNLAAILFTLTSSWFGKKIGVKQTILTGLTLFLIGGVGPAFVSSYGLILALRFLMGAGLGLFNPYSISLIYRFYQKGELKQMLGLQNATQNLGSALFAVLLGVLITFGWRAAYVGYAVALVPIALFALFMKAPNEDDQAAQPEGEIKNVTNWKVIGLAVFTGILFILFSMITVVLPSLVVAEKITTAGVASTILSLLSIASLVSSPFFGKLSKRLGRKVMPLSLLGITAGYFCLVVANSVALITLGVVLAGIFFGLALPQVMLLVKVVAPKEGQNFSTSIVLLGINVGVFVAPTVINFIAQLVASDTPHTIVVVCMVGFLIVTVLDILSQLAGAGHHALPQA